nr:MAG TPA: hypothetical protein [Caudoviricetes sp.]
MCDCSKLDYIGLLFYSLILMLQSDETNNLSCWYACTCIRKARNNLFMGNAFCLSHKP